MGMPEQVQEQKRKMEELVEQQGATEETPAPEETTQVPEEPQTDVVEEGRPEQEEPDLDAIRQEREDLQRKYDELQKRYRAEVSPLKKQVDALQKGSSWAQQQLAELDSENRKLKEALTPKTVPEAPKFPRVDLDRFKQDYDDESLQTIAQSTNAIADAFEQYRAELERLKAQVGQYGDRMQQTEQDRFLSAVAEAVPDWEEINRQAFEDGRMLKPIPATPWLTYDQALKEAQKRGNAQGAIEILKGWKEREPVEGDQPSTPTEEHIVPDGNRAGTPPGPRKKQEKITAAQIAALAEKLTKNQGNPELMKAYKDLYARFLHQERQPGR